MSENSDSFEYSDKDEVEKVADIGWRTCEACGVPKQLIAKNFRSLPKTDTKFDHVCKPCRAALIRKQKLDRLEHRACNNFLEKANSGGSNIPHTSEILESIVTLMGGANGLASALMAQYHAAPPGGRIRTSLLQMIFKLSQDVADSGATRAPAALLSDEELEAAIEERMKTAVLTFKGQQVLGVEADIPDCGRSIEVEERKLA